ncbi:MAG: nucleoside 2-deoxyribosyltransferase [Candidatus Geothermincolia bacterium]
MAGKCRHNGQDKGLVYLAGPFYSPEERQALATIASRLRKAGYAVYDPATDGLELEFLAAAGPEERELLRHKAFAHEIYQLVERCDALVFNMNGRVPDEGSVFKAAVAFAAGKPVVLYKRDHRSKLHGNENAMVTGLTHRFRNVKKAAKLAAELDRSLARAAEAGGAPYAGVMPPLVAKLVADGREVAKLLM